MCFRTPGTPCTDSYPDVRFTVYKLKLQGSFYQTYCLQVMADACEETTQTFLARLNKIITHGFVSMAISLGIQTGLFDALVKLHESERTSKEIADAAGLKERYVREWLGAMAVARIVDVNPETELYRLPSHRVPCFNRGSDASDLAALSTALPMFAEVYDKLGDCLTKDGPSGLPYSNYIGFHSFMAMISSRWVHNHLIQDFMPSMPNINEALKLGIKVLDLGCGRGISTNVIAEHRPNSSIIGLDFSEECIDIAREEARKKGLSNVEFICCDAISLPNDWSDTIDYVYAFDVIHDLAYADKVLTEVKRVLKPGGVFSMIDPDCKTKHSDNLEQEYRSRIYTISLFHCLPISLYFKDSVGLGTAWGREKATEYLRKSGFSVDSISSVPGSTQAHYMCSKLK